MKANIDEMKVQLRDEFGYDEKYLFYATDDLVASEYECCLNDKAAGTSHTRQMADISIGRCIDDNGEVYIFPEMELEVGYGIPHEKIRRLKEKDLWELWSKVTGDPIPGSQPVKDENNLLKFDIPRFNP